ncbi:hypothetical protein FLONG3_8494 [Fusarium longipes]|uniref:Uncharacterized protein n=1 Tax=Fusarium longipes TaxID=694270 RepID=A0A395S4Y6_9HYPO|nr:hypothetical protein FLONG3_8494 [Fusarium longipes]
MAEDNSPAINHPARVLFFYSAVIGIPLNLIRFIVMLRPTAILTIVLLVCSAVLAWIIRRRGAHIRLPSGTPIIKPWNCLVADISLAILSFIVLIFTWTHNHENDTGKIFLVAYSSTSLIFNMFLHFYLALLVLLSSHKMQDFIRERMGDLAAGTPHECENCHRRPETQSAEAEEQGLISSTTDEEDGTHGSGRGSSDVWN